MQLSPDAFNAFLGAIGQQFQWRRAYACPCVNPHSGAAKQGCPNCHGKGQYWVAPVAAVAGMASQEIQQKWQQFGRYEEGDAVVTIGSDSPMYAMGQFDRVTMLNNKDPFSMVLTRGNNDVLHFMVDAFARCYWLDNASAIVEGGLPVADANGNLTWPNGGAPPAGTQYSLTGSKFSEYYVFDKYPSDRGEHSGALLPKKVVLRKFDLFGR